MLKVGQVVKGYVKCGIKNAFYNQEVLLEVIYHGRWGTEVRTLDTRDVEHHIDTIRNGKVVSSRVEVRNEAYEGWLDESKGFEIVG